MPCTQPARRQTECAYTPDYRPDHDRSAQYNASPGLCAELLAHVQAAQPDTGLPGFRVVRSDVAAAHRPQRISPNPAVPPVRPKDLNQYQGSGGDELLLVVRRLDLELLVRQREPEDLAPRG